MVNISDRGVRHNKISCYIKMCSLTVILLAVHPNDVEVHKISKERYINKYKVVNVDEQKTEVNAKELSGTMGINIGLSRGGVARGDTERGDTERGGTERGGTEVIDDREIFLLKLDSPDITYKGTKIYLSELDRDFLERLVMGEASDEDYIGAVIVAQAIRDSMVSDNLTARQVHKVFKYTDNINRKPYDYIKKAVEFVFDKGGSAVQHRIMYFYAPKMVKSKWHETQKFIIEYGGHRVFDRVNDN